MSDTPPKGSTPSQLDLSLFELDPLFERNYSFLFHIYDQACRFVYDRQAKFLEKATPAQMVNTTSVEISGSTVSVHVTAANVLQTKVAGKKMKRRVLVFPGVREERIEYALRKMASHKRATSHQPDSGNYKGYNLVGLSFTLYELRRELEQSGIRYNIDDLKEGLRILNQSHLSIDTDNGSGLDELNAPFLPVLILSDREAAAQGVRCFVAFHPLVSHLINDSRIYRYNYSLALSFRNNYARSLFYRLSMRWSQASIENSYTISLSTAMDAIPNRGKVVARDKALFVEVLNELKEKGVISGYDLYPKKSGRKILDWIFTLHSTEWFAKQMASNNSRRASLGAPHPAAKKDA